MILIAATGCLVGEYLEMIILEERIGDSVFIVRDGSEVLQMAARGHSNRK